MQIEGPFTRSGDESESDPALGDRAIESTLTASRALLGVVASSLSEALELVSMPQFRVMVVLATAGPTRMTSLAEKVGSLPSTFSRTIDRMVEGGWVERRQSPGSRREVLIELSAHGRQLVNNVTDRRRQQIKEILADMAPADRTAVGDALEMFAAAAHEQPPQSLLVLGL